MQKLNLSGLCLLVGTVSACQYDAAVAEPAAGGAGATGSSSGEHTGGPVGVGGGEGVGSSGVGVGGSEGSAVGVGGGSAVGGNGGAAGGVGDEDCRNDQGECEAMLEQCIADSGDPAACENLAIECRLIENACNGVVEHCVSQQLSGDIASAESICVALASGHELTTFELFQNTWGTNLRCCWLAGAANGAGGSGVGGAPAGTGGGSSGPTGVGGGPAGTGGSE